MTNKLYFIYTHPECYVMWAIHVCRSQYIMLTVNFYFYVNCYMEHFK